MNTPVRHHDISVRQAALIGGFGVLTMVAPAPFAEFVTGKYSQPFLPAGVR